MSQATNEQGHEYTEEEARDLFLRKVWSYIE